MFLDILAGILLGVVFLTVGLPMIGMIFNEPPKTYLELWRFGFNVTMVMGCLAGVIAATIWALRRLLE